MRIFSWGFQPGVPQIPVGIRGWLRVHLWSEEVAGPAFETQPLCCCVWAGTAAASSCFSLEEWPVKFWGGRVVLRSKNPAPVALVCPKPPKLQSPSCCGPGSWCAAAQSLYEPIQALVSTPIRPRRMGRAGSQELRYKAPNESVLTGDLAVEGSAQAARLLLLDPLSCRMK